MWMVPPPPLGRPHRGGEGGGEPAPGILGGRRGVCGGEAVQHDLQRQRERRRHLGILQVENTLHFDLLALASFFLLC